MLDFTEFPKDGNEFELFVREVLFKLGQRPFWGGKGPDGGRDLLCEEPRESVILPDTRLWLVQCKHNAHSGDAVGIKGLDSMTDSCTHHNAEGYLLVCSTYPSSTVVGRLEAITKNEKNHLVATYWDAVRIERILKTPTMWPVAQRFFPRSAIEWEIYATDHPNRWIANHRGYYFHLCNRIGSGYRLHLTSIAARLRELETIPLPQSHLLRLRAVHFDDKNGNYIWFVDYLYPSRKPLANAEQKIKTAMKDGWTWDDGQHYRFDIRCVQYNPVSDHHDRDHYDYYMPFLSNFFRGALRDEPWQWQLTV